MTVKMAHAYDSLADQWIGQVPLSWFDTFPHLKHEGPDGERPDVEHTPLGSMNVTALREYAATRLIDLGAARKKVEIIEAIAAAEEVPGDPETPDDPADLEVDAGDD